MIVQTHDTMGLGLGLAQCGEQHAGKNGNDGDDHQQFDQRKSVRVASTPREAIV